MNIVSVEKIDNLRGKRVLLRLDLNVPIENGLVKDGFRIQRSQKTIEFLKNNGAKVIIISHTESGENKSLRAAAEYMEVPFVDMYEENFSFSSLVHMKEGDMVMIENLRKDPGEKNNDINFVNKLASLGDVYVNEAFSVSHREHASIVGLPKLLPTYFGFLFLEEVENLSKAFKPEHPFVFVLGGAKLETKLPLVKKFLNIADKIYIGGALINCLLKEQGHEIGKSVCNASPSEFEELLRNPKIIIPKDVIVQNEHCRCEKSVEDVMETDTIRDVGPIFNDALGTDLLSAQFILWNGPLGLVEEGFDVSTNSVARTIAISEARSIVGGGDTVAAIRELDIYDRLSFVSTGGGAMLDFLANGTLPGIDAVSKHA